MGWRGTLVLLTALVTAGLYAYSDVISKQSGLSWRSLLQPLRPAPPGEQVTHLLSFVPEQVTAIRLQRGDADVRFERRGGTWAGVARPQVLDDMLRNLLELAEVMPLQVGPDQLADYGLAPPEARIDLQRSNQPPIVVLVGSHNPPATGVYVQLGEGGPVKLTGALILWELDKAFRLAGER